MVLRALRPAFSSPLRLAVAVLIAASMLAAIALAPNLALVQVLWADGTVSLIQKATIIFALTGSLVTSFTPLAALAAVAASALTGTNAVLAYHLVVSSRARGAGVPAAGGVAGTVAALIGTGCGACGSTIAVAFLGTAAGAGALAALPLGGQEFALAGLALLAASTYALARRIVQPLACPVGVANQ